MKFLHTKTIIAFDDDFNFVIFQGKRIIDLPFAVDKHIETTPNSRLRAIVEKIKALQRELDR